MGTSWHVSYMANSVVADQVRQGIEARLEAVNASMSTYRPDSEISHFNAASVDVWVEVSAGFIQVLQAALSVGQASRGAYDVTIGPVVNLWGFGPQTGGDTIPSKAEIAMALALTGQHKLRLNADATQLLKSAALSLDFSSIAKGYAVDIVADWLTELEVEDFLVEVGGEMRLAGHNARGQVWRIAIEQPGAVPGSVASAIGLSNMAVATSGDYRNYFEVDGKRYSHTIDARSGYPVAHDLVSVTVVHPQAMMADAWATALTVLGAQEALAVALEQNLAVYFIRRKGDNYSGSYSPQFEPYLQNPAR